MRRYWRSKLSENRSFSAPRRHGRHVAVRVTVSLAEKRADVDRRVIYVIRSMKRRVEQYRSRLASRNDCGDTIF